MSTHNVNLAQKARILSNKSERILVDNKTQQTFALSADIDISEAKREADNLILLSSDGEEIFFENFFVLENAEEHNLPEFELDDGNILSSSDFFEDLNLDLDLSTAAGPTYIAGSGAGNYADNSGDLMGGVDKLGDLESFGWEPTKSAASESIFQTNPLADLDAPTGDNGHNDGDTPENKAPYSSRAILFKYPFFASNEVAFRVLDENNKPMDDNSFRGTFSLESAADQAYFVLPPLIDANGIVKLTLTTEGINALSAASKNLYDYLTVTHPNGTSYRMQVVVNKTGNYKSSDENDLTNDGFHVSHEWQQEKSLYGGTNQRQGELEGNNEIWVNNMFTGDITTGNGTDLIEITNDGKVFSSGTISTGLGGNGGDKVHLTNTAALANTSTFAMNDLATIKEVHGDVFIDSESGGMRNSTISDIKGNVNINSNGQTYLQSALGEKSIITKVDGTVNITHNTSNDSSNYKASAVTKSTISHITAQQDSDGNYGDALIILGENRVGTIVSGSNISNIKGNINITAGNGAASYPTVSGSTIETVIGDIYIKSLHSSAVSASIIDNVTGNIELVSSGGVTLGNVTPIANTGDAIIRNIEGNVSIKNTEQYSTALGANAYIENINGDVTLTGYYGFSVAYGHIKNVSGTILIEATHAGMNNTHSNPPSNFQNLIDNSNADFALNLIIKGGSYSLFAGSSNAANHPGGEYTNIIKGSSFDDTIDLHGSVSTLPFGHNIINTFAGDDIIRVHDGLWSQLGTNTLDLGAGNDFISISKGKSDYAIGGTGKNLIKTGDGEDTVIVNGSIGLQGPGSIIIETAADNDTVLFLAQSGTPIGKIQLDMGEGNEDTFMLSADNFAVFKSAFGGWLEWLLSDTTKGFDHNIEIIQCDDLDAMAWLESQSWWDNSIDLQYGNIDPETAEFIPEAVPSASSFWLDGDGILDFGKLDTLDYENPTLILAPEGQASEYLDKLNFDPASFEQDIIIGKHGLNLEGLLNQSQTAENEKDLEKILSLLPTSEEDQPEAPEALEGAELLRDERIETAPPTEEETQPETEPMYILPAINLGQGLLDFSLDELAMQQEAILKAMAESGC